MYLLGKAIIQYVIDFMNLLRRRRRVGLTELHVIIIIILHDGHYKFQRNDNTDDTTTQNIETWINKKVNFTKLSIDYTRILKRWAIRVVKIWFGLHSRI